MRIPGKRTRTHVIDGPEYGLCPYGNKPGDLIYVREAWKSDSQLDHIKPSELSPYEPRQYLADGKILEPSCMMITPGKYRPAMYMPRAFSRLTLEITEVRAELLTSITEADAIAEGAMSEDYEQQAGEGYTSATCWHHGQPENDNGEWFKTATESFRDLWQSINGPKSWRPDWVWVVSFKPHFCNIDTLINARAAA